MHADKQLTYDELNNDLLTQTDVLCYYLTVRSLLEAKEYNEALQVINESEMCTNMTQSGITFADRTDILQDAPKNVSASTYTQYVCEYKFIFVII